MPFVYTTDKPANTLTRVERPSRELLPGQVRIRITHCGVCQSDLSFMQNDYGDSQYPMIPGHEIVGQVIECASGTSHFSIGERVAVSWQVNSCRTCRCCSTENEALCPDLKAIAIGEPGGFAEEIVVDQHFVYHLPDNLDSIHAAPLMCAGSTMFNAIKITQIQSGMRVGVIGIGGLGHLGILLLKAMGCDVVAFSHTESKEKDAFKLGATQFVNCYDKEAIEAAHCDVILSTISQRLDYDTYIKSLNPCGQFCFVGIPNLPATLDIFPLLIGQKRILASPLGSVKTNQELIEFAAKHDIKPWVEILPMSQINDALDRLANYQTHYRIVLVNE